VCQKEAIKKWMIQGLLTSIILRSSTQRENISSAGGNENSSQVFWLIRSISDGA